MSFFLNFLALTFWTGSTHFSLATERLKETATTVWAIEGQFQQTKHNPSMGTKKQQEGRFALLKPNAFFWDISEGRTVIGNGPKLWVLERDVQKKVYRVVVDRKFNLQQSKIARLLIQPDQALKVDFDATSTSANLLTLTPKRSKQKTDGEGFTSLSVYLSESKPTYIQKLVALDESGQTTEILFASVSVQGKSEFLSRAPSQRQALEQKFTYAPLPGVEIVEAQHASKEFLGK